MQTGIGSRVIRLCVVAAFAAVLWPGGDVARADGMIIPWGLGMEYLEVRYHHVTVEIADTHAVTHVDQEFHNPHGFEVAGQYLFPVPPGAMLSSFQASVDGETRPVVRQDVAQTNAALRGAVGRLQDPSLLRYMDWESFALEVTLGPGETCRIVLEYDELLMPTGGLFAYRYILSTERYSHVPLEEVSIAVEVHSSAGLAALYSPSHDIVVERGSAQRATATWSAEGVRPTEDFVLYFSPANQGFGSGLLTGRHGDQDYFLFLFAPDSEIVRQDVIPKDIVFVFDRSGSMWGEKVDQARKALHFILDHLGESDRFSIVSFNDTRSQLFHTLQPVNTETLAEAGRFVDRIEADGLTDLDTALRTGLGILEASESRQAARLVVFLTDGLPTAGLTDAEQIMESVRRANAEVESRIHVFGVGYDVNTHLLDQVAADAGGTVTYVTPNQDLEAVLTGFYSRISQPVLTDVQITYSGMEVSELHPASAPDLFEGSLLLIAGRFRPSSDTVRVQVRGQAGEERHVYTYEFELDQTAGREFVPRVWATRQIGALLDEVRVAGETEDLVAEIRDLGLEFGLVTPYTTFVVAGQADGAASAENMLLYGDVEGLGQAWGRTTVLARVQNQGYQSASNAMLAQGANVVSFGGNAMAQLGVDQTGSEFGDLSVDLSLLQNREQPSGQIDVQWIADNVGIDRVVAFGSEDYFALADDPHARSFLQAGKNAVFSLGDEVIQIEAADSPDSASVSTDGAAADPDSAQGGLGGGSARAVSLFLAPKTTADTDASTRRPSLPFLLALGGFAAAAVVGSSLSVVAWKRLRQ
jgi:Ca-activated chloride channel family protein